MIHQEKTIFKQLLPHLCAVICFLSITFVYFSPILQGKVLIQNDTVHYLEASQEVKSYYYNDGQASGWTGSMFSGMPSYQIGTWGGPAHYLNYLDVPLHALGGPMGAVFTGMLMAYILFLVMGFSPMVSFAGAIAYSLSSYNLIILDAGHLTKAWSIAYMPLVIAGLLVLFRKKYLIGTVVLASGLALQIKSNHLQITYYTAILCAILYLSFVVKSIKNKDFKTLLKVSGLAFIGVTMAIMCNIGSLYSNYEMGNESIRGKSELSTNTGASTEKKVGLDKEYVFQWSYGKAETFSLLVPNINGGGSGGMFGPSTALYKALSAKGAPIPAEGIPFHSYWGEQPFTSGPVYFGAIVCFLFLLGICIIPSRMKWVFLGATLLFFVLSWGKNFDLVNDWFYYHFPLYAKFRAVSMALVIPALTMLIVAIWGLNEFLTGNLAKEKLQKALYISAGISGGICLLLWIIPGAFFNFTCAADAHWSGDYPAWFYSALLADRKEFLSSDALRSLIFIISAAGTLFIVLKKEREKIWILGASVVISMLILVDLWGVDQRYLNDSKFQTKNIVENTFRQTPADKAILQDKTPSYRVLNLTVSTFQDATTSYYHKSIGGYSAVKLKRYQNLIDYYLQPEIANISKAIGTQNEDSVKESFASANTLNMLNAKYIIYNPKATPLVNTYAYGNAWFVHDYTLVNDANEEIARLKNIDPKKTIVIDKRFQDCLNGFTPSMDSTAQIVLTKYTPNVLTYKSKTTKDQLAVFSEIYYDKGWNAYVDGKLTPHFRADWTLRAMCVPAGEHEIIFKFEPKIYRLCRMIDSVSSAILLLVLFGIIGLGIFKTCIPKK